MPIAIPIYRQSPFERTSEQGYALRNGRSVSRHSISIDDEHDAFSMRQVFSELTTDTRVSRDVN
jgi:hypothetical protein